MGLIVDEPLQQTEKDLADSAYNGGTAERVRTLRQGNRSESEFVKRPEDVKVFLVLARCLVVERTFTWLRFNHCLNEGYEQSSRSFSYLCGVMQGSAEMTPHKGSGKKCQ